MEGFSSERGAAETTLDILSSPHPLLSKLVNTHQAPVTPQTAIGQQLSYLLRMEPHLFRAAVDAELSRISAEREARAEALLRPPEAPQPPPATPAAGDDAPSSLVLYQRMEQVRRGEQALSVQDLMYASVLERFLELGVAMLPRLRNEAPVLEAHADLVALTEGVHSREALDLVKEHVRGVLGPASTAFSNAVVRMSRLQAAQVYAASVLFGYFLRKVDSRFQLERSARTLPGDAVARLEALFAAAAEADDAGSDADAPAPPTSGAADAAVEASRAPRGGAALKGYIEEFDAATMAAMARVVSSEGAALVDAQVRALFGDLSELQKQMAEAVGDDARSMEDLMLRVRKAVADGTVETLALTAGTQRRAVLEAVAYGAFLRDVENHVDSEYGLLTPAPSSPGGGGGMGFGGGGGDGDRGGGGGGGGGGGRGPRAGPKPVGPGGATATM